MTKIRKTYGNRFKLKVALEAIKGNKTVTELCSEFGVASSQIYAWKKQLEEGVQTIFDGKGTSSTQDEIDKLHRVIGKITKEASWLTINDCNDYCA